MIPREKYRAGREKVYPFTEEMLDLMHRRTMPFLNGLALTTRPIAHIVQEAYLQGIKDACDALDHRAALSLPKEEKK